MLQINDNEWDEATEVLYDVHFADTSEPPTGEDADLAIDAWREIEAVELPLD